MIVKIKHIIFELLFLGLGVFFFNACTFCKDCGGNYLQPIKDKLPYTNGTILKFSNNTRIDFDTVKINYSEPSEEYYCGGKENPLDCAGDLDIYIGDFYIGYSQGGYHMRGLKGPFIGFNNAKFIKKDTVDYSYHGKNIKAFYYIVDTSLYAKRGQSYIDSINKLPKYYYDFYLTPDNRLLQYSFKNKGVLEKWTEVK